VRTPGRMERRLSGMGRQIEDTARWAARAIEPPGEEWYFQDQVIVYLTATETGAHKYAGKIVQEGDAILAVDVTRDLSVANDIGSLPAGEDALVYNLAELADAEDHALSWGSADSYFSGRIIGYATDGRTIVVIYGYQAYICTIT
jgi:hypothetical protein